MPNNQKQFVIHQHTKGENIHWDLMLEYAGSLQTFRLSAPPGELLTKPGEAVKIADHDPKFLTYQGPVNNGAGSVKIADKGLLQIKNQDSNRIEMDMVGKILKGSFTITNVKKDKWQIAPVKD